MEDVDGRPPLSSIDTDLTRTKKRSFIDKQIWHTQYTRFFPVSKYWGEYWRECWIYDVFIEQTVKK